MSQFTGQYQFDQPVDTQMTAGVVVTIQLVIAVLVVPRRIVEGLTAGGVKQPTGSPDAGEVGYAPAPPANHAAVARPAAARRPRPNGRVGR